MSVAKKVFDNELVTKGLSGEELIHLVVEEKRRHICQEDGFLCADEIKIAEKTSDPKSIDWVNPIYNIFSSQNIDVKTYKIEKGLDKNFLLSEIENLLIVSKVKQTLLQDICLAIEETVSNVLMHAAPHIRNSTIGQLQVALDPANFKAGFVCQDFAGKMDTDKMLGKIRKCYFEGVGNSISMTTRGAGIGTFLVFHGASSYFLFNKLGTSAFVGASYPIMADKKRLAFSKHFHISNE